MNYSALAVGIANALLLYLHDRLIIHNLHFDIAPTVREASRLLSQKAFHLLIVDLMYLRNTGQANWLENIRSISFVPLIVLSETPEQDCDHIIKLGADVCISGKCSPSILANVLLAQFRRYTIYSHYDSPQGWGNAPFTSGDIYVDPLRRVVKVKEREVTLRRREFLLLHYFMKNPKIILSAEQICDNAWGNEGSYASGVSSPIAILRKAIEPDPAHPIYIETVNTLGYRFTEHKE